MKKYMSDNELRNFFYDLVATDTSRLISMAEIDAMAFYCGGYNELVDALSIGNLSLNLSLGMEITSPSKPFHDALKILNNIGAHCRKPKSSLACFVCEAVDKEFLRRNPLGDPRIEVLTNFVISNIVGNNPDYNTHFFGGAKCKSRNFNEHLDGLYSSMLVVRNDRLDYIILVPVYGKCLTITTDNLTETYIDSLTKSLVDTMNGVLITDVYTHDAILDIDDKHIQHGIYIKLKGNCKNATMSYGDTYSLKLNKDIIETADAKSVRFESYHYNRIKDLETVLNSARTTAKVYDEDKLIHDKQLTELKSYTGEALWFNVGKALAANPFVSAVDDGKLNRYMDDLELQALIVTFGSLSNVLKLSMKHMGIKDPDLISNERLAKIAKFLNSVGYVERANNENLAEFVASAVEKWFLRGKKWSPDLSQFLQLANYTKRKEIISVEDVGASRPFGKHQVINLNSAYVPLTTNTHGWRSELVALIPVFGRPVVIDSFVTNCLPAVLANKISAIVGGQQVDKLKPTKGNITADNIFISSKSSLCSAEQGDTRYMQFIGNRNDPNELETVNLKGSDGDIAKLEGIFLGFH